VLDVGCGVATTAIEIAHRHNASVTAVDIAPLMLERAGANVAAAGLVDRVSVEHGDILALPYPDPSFDVVIAGAVTMFVDREKAAAELARVAKPGGRVLATEFFWREPPSDEAREIFLTPRGFLSDEGFLRSMAIMGRVASRRANMKKMTWLMPRMAKAVPYLGYILVAGTKPA
jgi:ubiquinone/menaquinone biosynthesis C-methylase UbiE